MWAAGSGTYWRFQRAGWHTSRGGGEEEIEPFVRADYSSKYNTSPADNAAPNAQNSEMVIQMD